MSGDDTTEEIRKLGLEALKLAREARASREAAVKNYQSFTRTLGEIIDAAVAAIEAGQPAKATKFLRAAQCAWVRAAKPVEDDDE